MATTTAPTSRFDKAIDIAATAASWAKCHTADGMKAYGIPSSRDPDHFHIVTQQSCTCQDAQRHPGTACKHMLAVRRHVAAVRQAAQAPVLQMVRHPDGDGVTWERDRASARRYDELVGSHAA